MNKFLQFLKRENNKTETENGAAAYRSTYSACLDLFSAAGAVRSATDEDINNRFKRAFYEDADKALKILFYTRDVRGGLGERRAFRVMLRELAVIAPESVEKNIPYIAEYGRYDDLVTLFGTSCEAAAAECIAKQLAADTEALEKGGSVSLLAKWLPSANATNEQTRRDGRRLAKLLNMTLPEYRKTLTRLRAAIRIIENDLRIRSYTFDYEKQPSRAMYKYRRAFIRNDGERYKEFMTKVSAGTAKLHTDNVAPYELVNALILPTNGRLKTLSREEENVINTTWAKLPDYGSDENILAVVDTSGSMYYSGNPKPAAVALSLGLYLAERNKGVFGNCFIEFSDKPTLIELKGRTFADKLRYAFTFNRIANTNLEAVFDLILRTAVNNRLSQSELPAKLVLISDMEFDSVVSNASETVYENARRKFEQHGYRLPDVVFWNVQSRNAHQPIRMDERGTALVSGASPRTFEMVAGGLTTPYDLMNEILNSGRYDRIRA